MKWEDVDLQPYTKEQVKQRDNQLKEWHEKQEKLKDKVQLNSGERLIWNAVEIAKSHNHIGSLMWDIAGELINKYYKEYMT